MKSCIGETDMTLLIYIYIILYIIHIHLILNVIYKYIPVRATWEHNALA